MLGQELVELDVQRVRKNVPHDLIVVDDSQKSVSLLERVSEGDEKDGPAVDGRDINRSIEWNRESRLQFETVQGDDIEILAVGLTNRTGRVGRLTLRPVFCVWSVTLKTSVGKGAVSR